MCGLPGTLGKQVWTWRQQHSVRERQREMNTMLNRRPASNTPVGRPLMRPPMRRPSMYATGTKSICYTLIKAYSPIRAPAPSCVAHWYVLASPEARIRRHERAHRTYSALGRPTRDDRFRRNGSDLIFPADSRPQDSPAHAGKLRKQQGLGKRNHVG